MRGRNYYNLKQGDGLVEFFMLDSTDFDNAQHAWLEQALSASNARWKIAVFHHPIYSSGTRHGSSTGLRSKLEPLFTKYKVNAAFSGHDHIYERTKPQQGIQYFVTGAGGKTRRGGVKLDSPIRQVSFDQDNHFMVIEIKPQQIGFQAVSETGQVVDSGLFGST
jgi:3',5'-cyclic AMP phosphodiesterase CpdA